MRPSSPDELSLLPNPAARLSEAGFFFAHGQGFFFAHGHTWPLATPQSHPPATGLRPMGFFNGRFAFIRFKVVGPNPRAFHEEHIERLRRFQAGRQGIASADGIEVGWTAGDHVLDTDFTLEKNIINDSLHCELRVDSEKLPTDLLRAYYAVELKALAADNPSGLATARQKREARELARERLEQEAKDGRYTRRKCIPVLWDARTNEVLLGTTSLAQVERLVALFQQTFGYRLEAMTAGKRAFFLAELQQRTRAVDDSAPSAFLPGFSPEDLAWIADESSRDFLGNEFLLWLWYHAEVEDDTLTLSDNSEATFMLARTLTLECPRGQTGHETISHESPVKLPEAKRAIQAGKLPRKAGLTLVRRQEQYEFTLHAETLAVGSGKLPPTPEDVTEARAKLDNRADQLRDFIETLDLLYEAFSLARLSRAWAQTLPKMQKWLAREPR